MLLSLAALAGLDSLCSAQEAPAKPASPTGASQPAAGNPPVNAPKPSTAAEENQALQEAVRSAARNPQALIKNLEQFLTRFPDSPRREALWEAIFRQAVQSNDPATAVTYGEKLLDQGHNWSESNEVNVLSTVVDLLSRENDPASRAKAIDYATRLVDRAQKMTDEPRPGRVSADQWRQTQALTAAAAYSLRAKIHAGAKEDDLALADYEKSYAAYPTSVAAEQLGDLDTRKGATDRALNDYASAFALRNPADDPAHLDELRRKLGSAYVAKHGSEKGLGDLVLERYDDLMRSLRLNYDARLRPNAENRDPFTSTLLRPDGTKLHLSELRGKVVVLDFWATWCGPCIMEGYLMERVAESFRGEPAAVFLAVNVDEDRSRVTEFAHNQHWTIPVVYAEGLDSLLEVRALPTLMILDREGRVVYRFQGADPDTDGFSKRIRAALDEHTPAAAGGN